MQMNNKVFSDSKIKRLLISHNIFVAARVAFEIFFNIYIWKQTNDLTLIAWFNIAYLSFHTFTFHGFARLVKKGKINFIRVSALLGYTAVYLGVYLLKENVIHYAIPMAIAVGFFNGMYWISYQVLRFDLTNSNNRGNYAGIETGMKIFVDIFMPILGGSIIAANFFGLGYSNLFLFGSFLFLVSFFVGNIRFPIYNTSNFHVKKTFNIMKKDKDMLKIMFSYLFGNFSRGGTVARLILPLLIFDVLRNELGLGAWLSVFSVITIFFSLFFGKFIKYKYYNKSLVTGGFFYFTIVLLLIFFPSFWVYILFGFLFKISGVLMHIPKRVIGENLIHSFEDEKNNRVEYIVIREWFGIGLGRNLSFFILLTVTNLAVDQMGILFLLLTVGVLIEVLLIVSAKRKIN